MSDRAHILDYPDMTGVMSDYPIFGRRSLHMPHTPQSPALIYTDPVQALLLHRHHPTALLGSRTCEHIPHVIDNFPLMKEQI
jgi:hypothetical protein